MAERPLISPDQVIGAAIDAYVARRPAALSHINARRGQIWAVIQAWRAQAATLIDRDFDELMQTRIATAEGGPLWELASSEFFCEVPNEATAAMGVAAIFAGSRTGIMPVGTRFYQAADASASPIARQAASWESTTPIYLNAVGGEAFIPIRATSAGKNGSIPKESGVTANWFTIDPTWDSNVIVEWLQAGGGSAAPTDAFIRMAALAQPAGQRGPTRGAALGGALLRRGVRHAVGIDLAQAVYGLFVADDAWGSTSISAYTSTAQGWCEAIQQDLIDQEITGFGCRVNVYGVVNKFVRVAPTVQLKSELFLANSEEITTAIQDAVRSYFDDRPDWYMWTASGLRAAISGAHDKILTCTSVSVTDRNNVAVTAPATDPLLYATPSSSLTATHYYLLNDGILPSYLPPA